MLEITVDAVVDAARRLLDSHGGLAWLSGRALRAAFACRWDSPLPCSTSGWRGPRWRSLALGAVLIIPGLVIRALASGHVRKNEALATSGPYAYTRNPLYLGSLLIGNRLRRSRAQLVGGRRAGRDVLRHLRAGDPERRSVPAREIPRIRGVCERVPRMIPRITPAFRDQAAGGFSMDLYLKHREYNALLGAVAMTVGLIVKMNFFHN